MKIIFLLLAVASVESSSDCHCVCPPKASAWQVKKCDLTCTPRTSLTTVQRRLMNFASAWANQILQDKYSSGCHCVCPQEATGVENTGGVSETVNTNTPAWSVVTETPRATTSTTTLTTALTTTTRTMEEEKEEESVTDKPLSKLTYKEACGRTPWLDEEFRASQASPRFFGQLSRKKRIVNGEKAEYGEWPWQVSLRQWNVTAFRHKCGATLLSDNWAVTAAHCVEGINRDKLLLRMGEYDANDEFPEPHSFQDRKVQIVASNPKFDPRTLEYDIALLRFSEPVTFQPNIIPICVPEEDQDLVGQTAWVTGWGQLYEDGPRPPVLQKVAVPIINNTQCEAMYEKAGFREHIPHIFICAGYREGGKDSCEGDSGGPMSVRREDGRYMLSGITSWGIGCGKKNQPGVYTRMSEFRDWVNQIIKY